MWLSGLMVEHRLTCQLVMNRLPSILYALGTTLLGQFAYAQSVPVSMADRLAFSQARYNHTRTLGLTLGGYALANLAVSGIAMGQTSGETKYIHQMNVYWNAVNLGIAGLGLLGLRKHWVKLYRNTSRSNEHYYSTRVSTWPT